MAGLGALASGSAAAIGTGAFSSVEAERDVTVEVGGDNSAYLGLEANRDDIISDDGDGGELTLDLGSGSGTSEGGDGFNQDAETEIDSVFRITNQGTEDVGAGFGTGGSIVNRNITTEIEPIDGVTLEIPDEKTESFDGSAEGAVLAPGDSVLVDVTVDTLDDSPEDESGSVIIGAYSVGGL